jgi:hypothetical protein
MIRLPLELTHREYLITREGLAKDAEENETLVGLSWSESVLYLRLVGNTLADHYPDEPIDFSTFLSPHQRHTAALPKYPWLLYPTWDVKKG